MTRQSMGRPGMIILGAVLLLAGCGGGGTNPSPPPPPPPPAPVVTSVEVSPASGPLFVTDTLQLAATVKDQSGAAIAGKALAWTSSSPSLATVSSTGLVIGVGVGNVTISAAVDGKSGSAILSVTDPGPRISTEAANVASGTIGVEGGSLTTTSGAGVSYRLIVPAGSLPAPTLIRMTPVTAVRKFPLSGGLAGGVDLQPSGLRFAVPARLRIAILQRPAAGMRLVGLSAEGDGAVLLASPALDSGTVASLPIQHFSGAVVGFGTQADMAQLLSASGGVTTDGRFYTDSLLELTSAHPPDAAAITQVMKNWFHNVVLPLFQNATTDQQLTAAVSEYNWWNIAAPLALGIDPPIDHPATYAAELGQLAPVAAARLRAAIDGNNVVCRSQQSFTALANVLFWQTQAQALGVATAAFHLDRASVLTGLCALVVLESALLPDPMDVGVPYSLDATFGVQFFQNGSPQGAPFGVQLSGAQLNIAHPTGASNISGFYTTVVSPTAPGPLQVTARACLILPGTTTATDVCGSGTVQSNGHGSCGRVVAGTLSIHSNADVLANADVSQAGGLSIGGNISNLSGLTCLTSVTGDVTISGSAPAFSLGNLHTIGGSLEIFGNTNLVSLQFGALHVGGNLEVDNNTVLATFTSGQLSVGANVEIDNNPALVTLVLGGGTIGGHLEIDVNDALQSIDVGTITILDHFEINRNPVLVSLSGSGTVGGHLEIDNNISLSNQAATTWAAGFAVTGTVLVVNNHSP